MKEIGPRDKGRPFSPLDVPLACMDVDIKNKRLEYIPLWLCLQAFVTSEHHKKHLAAEELESLLQDKKDALILDLAAGTGIVGQLVSRIIICVWVVS